MATYPKNGKQKQKIDLRRLYKKYQDVWDAIFKLPRIKLDKPRFAGYKRFFVLREDIANRKDARELREILFLINNVRYSRIKDFSEHDIEDPPWNYKQKIKTLDEKQFNKLNPHQKKFFWRTEKVSHRKIIVRYVFQFPYYFVYKIKHHYITEVPLIVPELESLRKEITNKIDDNNLWPKIDHMLGRCRNDERDYTGSKARILDYLSMKEMVEDLERMKTINGY